MLIPQKYPQFINQSALLVVTSRQNAVFYQAADGVLNVIEEICIEKPRYSDREGQFKTRAHGMVARTGAPLEDVGDQAQHDFILELRSGLAEILKSASPQKVYLFTPDYLKNSVLDCVPNQYQFLVEDLIEGNYLNTNPLELLSKIEAKEKNKFTPAATAEAQKILQLPHLKFRGT